MERTRLDNVEIEYETRGHGEPVLFVHPGIFADWFTPLFDQPALAGRYAVVHYHRAGSAGSGHPKGSISLTAHAVHARLLLQHLGIARAHLAGHSSSGNVVLQTALDAPGKAQSLAILEPALMSVPSAATSRAFVGAAVERFRAGDPVGAVDLFLQGTCGREYRPALEVALPGALERYAADAATFFEQELPALQQWSFRREDASRIAAPTLAVVGSRSLQMDPIWGERHQLLLDWLPNVEPFVLADASHLLQIENPAGMAAALAAFWAQHPLPMA
jgi:pimeloyl-ACP methyl ester carboxylesterase